MDTSSMISGAADTARMQAGQAKMQEVNLRTQRKTSPEEIDRTATEFEAMFLSQMLGHMFTDIDLMPMSDGPGEDIYKSMLVDEYGKVMARSGGIGIADQVRREMLQMQEVGYEQ